MGKSVMTSEEWARAYDNLRAALSEVCDERDKLTKKLEEMEKNCNKNAKVTMKVYDVFLFSPNGGSFVAAVPAINEEAAREYVKGNGEVVAIKEADERLSEEVLANDLLAEGWSRRKIDIACRALYQIGLIE